MDRLRPDMSALGGTVCEQREYVATVVATLAELHGADSIPNWEVTDAALEAFDLEDHQRSDPRVWEFRQIAAEELRRAAA